MRLNVIALSLTAGLLWAAVMLVVGLMHYAWPPYGSRFLEVMESVYPGYDIDGSPWRLLVGTVYGLIDGAFAAAVFGLVYNAFARRFSISMVEEPRS